MSDSVKKWYVLRAIGGKEKKVKEYVENEIAKGGLQGFVSQVLIPNEKVYQIRNGKKISKERSLYPGYVLIEAVLAGEVAHILRNIPNVIGFLGDTKGGTLCRCGRVRSTASWERSTNWPIPAKN